MLIRFLKYRNGYHSNNFNNFFVLFWGLWDWFFLFLMLCLSVVQRNKSIELQTTNEYQTNYPQKKNKDWPLLGPRQQLKYFEHKKYDELLAPNSQYLTWSIWPQLSIAMYHKNFRHNLLVVAFLSFGCKS